MTLVLLTTVTIEVIM
jgi:hypothetical protein